MNIRVECIGFHEHMISGQRVSNAEEKKQSVQDKCYSDAEKLKPLIIEIVKPSSFKMLNKVQEIIDRYELQNLSGKLTESKLCPVIQKWGMKYKQLYPQSDNINHIIIQQEQRVQLATTALGEICRELLKERAEVNYSYSLFKSAKESIQNLHEKSNDDKITVHTSYAELWGRVAQAIQGIKSRYVDFYANLMKKYTDMYEAFNEYVQKSSSDAVSTGDDGNNVSFDTGTMKSGYDNFSNALENIDLGVVKNWIEMTPTQQAGMRATLAPAFKINEAGGIFFNMDQYDSIKHSYPAGIKNGKVSTASYQAWLATFNASGTALQSNMQSFAQRYSQANSTFDNLNKVLSGAISSLADSAKEVLKSLS
ncbi:TPA: IpaD/SipD/SspD family type III secretion system needle tip protein [Escherichia coli]|uniref:IpaD/SipD/SspD family type III secretion system needle tip protein n=1 Tax=Escherichia coli TaxID=562 RepID=UPI002FF3E5F5